jgi:hypothetical protein
MLDVNLKIQEGKINSNMNAQKVRFLGIKNAFT